MGINFSGDYTIKGSSATVYSQNGATSDSVGGSYNNIGFYSGSTEHMRFDDYGIMTNVWGSPATVLRKTEGGNTPNQNPIPMTLTAGSMPTCDPRNNVGIRSGLNCVTIPIAGLYRCSISTLLIPNAVCSINVNGSYIYYGVHAVGLGVSYITMSNEIIVRLAAGDQINAQSWNSGGIYGAYGWTSLTVSFIG